MPLKYSQIVYDNNPGVEIFPGFKNNIGYRSLFLNRIWMESILKVSSSEIRLSIIYMLITYKSKFVCVSFYQGLYFSLLILLD